MISTLKFKFGRAAGQSAETLSSSPVTVFVGPNNSGKSKILAEIEEFCRTGVVNASAVILADVTFAPVSDPEQAIAKFELAPNPDDFVNEGHIFVGKHGKRVHIHRESLLEVLRQPGPRVNQFCQWFLTHHVLMLDGLRRITLVHDQPAGDMQAAPASSLQVLFRDNTKRQEVRRIVAEAIGSYFVLDPTNLGNLRIRLSDRQPANELEERGIHEEAVAFHRKAQRIHEASDGVKAFIGILTEIIAGDPQVILIDEPEAFLHPPLASKLGVEVARAALQSDKRVFVSTHSPQFVMGCTQSGVPINIVRLTYRGGVATARILPSAEILELMRNPLLRSTGVLSGLFYEFVVVTESDSDRAFYQEINERLLRYKPEWGIPNCLFINAQNKHTVHTILRPLRKLGIPTAGIVDVDVFKDAGTNWTNLVGGANMPGLQQQSLSMLRGNVRAAIEKTGRDMKRDGGLALLSGEEREAGENLVRQLAEYGIFVVSGGELESWLTHLGGTGHGPPWLISVFEKMGADPEDAGYVKPTADDVWRFLSTVRGWLFNPLRQGIPA